MAVPVELYKVVLVQEGGRSRLISMIMPNAEVMARSLDSVIVSAAEVEKRTGLRFFPELDVNR